METIILIILIFWLLNFLGLTNFSTTILLIVLLPSFVYSMTRISHYKDKMTSPFLVVAIGLILSCVSSMFYEEQTFGQCFNGLAPMLPLFFVYYFLKSYKIDAKVVLNALQYASITYCLFYIINYILMSIMGISLIAVSDVALEKGLDARVRIPGSMLASYLFFLSLNRFLTDRSKLKPLSALLLSASVILIMAFRTMIAGIGLLSIIELLMIKGVRKSTLGYALFAVIMLVAIYNLPVFQQKIEYMIEKQSDSKNTFADKDYIRWITFDYFMNGFFKSKIEMFLGSGPTGYGSGYTKRLVELQEYGLYTADWGLIGDAWKYGVITVSGWIWFSVKMIRRKWSKQYKYLSVIYCYLLLISVTTVEFSRPGNFVIHAIVLYLYSVLPKKEKGCESEF